MDICFPPFRLDLAGERLWRGNDEIRLRPKTFAVLRCLVERPGRWVSAAELLRTVWSDVAVSEAMPRLCVRELRASLGDDSRHPRYIETRPGRGYQFVAQVVRVTVPESSEAAGRRTATAATHGPPFVGREVDLDRLAVILDRANRGERQTVFVSGEPGIGKTSLVEGFLAGSAAAADLWLAKGECVEQYGAGEAYLPILSALERLWRVAGTDGLREALHRVAPTWLAQMSSVIGPAEHETLMRRLGGTTPHRMLRELASLLESLATKHGVIIWLEDLHWADSSTIEAIAFLARRVDLARLLLVGTYRSTNQLGPEHPLTRVKHELQMHGRCRELALAPLAETAVAEYLTARLPGPPVSAELVRHVHRRTDGNPLFMAMVADDLVARALLVQREGAWTVDDARAERLRDVPDTLRQLVEQQAQRLQPDELQLVEVASVGGAEFSAAVVAAAVGEDLAPVEGRCARLARFDQFLKPKGESHWPDGTTSASYTFRHALHQEVIYQGIPAGRRRELHGRIAERLERAFGRRTRDIAAELAMHCERARDARRAVQYHQVAGENALGRAAHAEAIVHLGRALELLPSLPDGRERTRREVAIHLCLGPAWIVAKGYAAVEVEHTYSRALQLSRRLGEVPALARALKGLWNVRLVRAELNTARKLASELRARAQAARDSTLRLRAHAELGETFFHLGDLEKARDHLTAAVAPASRHAARPRTQDPRVASYMSWALWLAGYPDQARRVSDRAVVEARILGHPHNRAFSLGFAGRLHELCGAASRVAELVDEQFSVCQEYGIPYWHSWAVMLKGWVLSRQGRPREGATVMREGLSAYRQTGAVVGLAHFLLILAEVHGIAGQLDAALCAADESFELARATGNKYFEPEVYRVRGELLSRLTDEGASPPGSGRHRPHGPERCLQRALKTAQHRAARSLELRAATSLARWWHERGENRRAQRLLGPLCAWFTEGADTADVVAARRLLAVLPPHRTGMP